MPAAPPYRAGYIGLAGRPNVGKSSLLNRLIGQKLSITSRRPQTTRNRVLGILTRLDAQFLFVDAPGLDYAQHSGLQRAMNRAAEANLGQVDAILLVVEALEFSAGDRRALSRLPAEKPTVLAVNKVDLVADKSRLLPYIEHVVREYPFRAVVPVSARRGMGVEDLLAELATLLPESPPLFAEDDVTDRSERFLAAELVREKLFRRLGAEVPYAAAVEIERFELDGALRRIAATVLVDKPGQKAIVIGKGGQKLKEVATQAREDMERLFGGKVFLEVWVKVKPDWMNDPATLQRLGYD